MLKKIFNLTALGCLATMIYAKIKGKTLNPLGLRIILTILTLMAWMFNSGMILIYAGTWLLFLLVCDVAKKFFGVEITLLKNKNDKPVSRTKVFMPSRHRFSADRTETIVCNDETFIPSCPHTHGSGLMADLKKLFRL